MRWVASNSASEHQKKDDAAYATANFVFFDERKSVANGSWKRNRASGALRKGRVVAAMENYVEKCDDMWGVAAADAPRKNRGISQEYLDACKKRRQQDLRENSTEEKTDHLAAS